MESGGPQRTPYFPSEIQNKMNQMESDFYSGKKILVAGGSGFIGTNLTATLSRMGAQIRSTFHFKDYHQRLESVEYVSADLLLSEDCARVTRDMDFVFMCAAESSGAEVIERTPLVHLTPNLIMNAHMLAAAYENKVKRFCFISSNTVYPLTDFAVRESDANFDYFEKYFIVGWMKRFSEIMCEMYSSKIQNPMETVTVRPGNLYGPFDKFNKSESKVIAALIRRAIEGEDPFTVWGDGFDIKDFLYIDDFIVGMLQAFAKAKDFDPINIASGNPVSIREIVNLILDITGQSSLPVHFDANKPTMIPKRMINIEKMKKLTQWQPQIDLREGILRTVTWYRDYFANRTPEEVEK
jgi:GDP-L-fucose synthase